MTMNLPRWSLSLALCSGYFLVLLDVTLINVALPQIGIDLDADTGGLAWVVDAYSVPLAALLLVSGLLGEHIGHRTVVLIGMLIFASASAACGLAPTIIALVGARMIQGVGAALMLPGTLALLVEVSSDESTRTRLVGVWAAVGGAALPAGPLLGGILVQWAGWRSVFWLSVPVIALALIPVLALQTPARPQRSGRSRQSPPQPRQTDAVRLGLASFVAGLMNLCALGGLFLLTQNLQIVHHLDALAAGLMLLPAMLPLPLLGAPAAWLATHIGTWRTSAIGALIAAVGMAGISWCLSANASNHVGLALFLALWGAGLGVLTPAIVASALKATPAAPGLASGASNTARQAGGALGIALFAAVAGSASSPEFTDRSAAVFIAATSALVLASAICLTTSRTTAQKSRT
ncbi:MFS transporter [Pseudoclavibacter sp. CFCC 14310]|uniref:MFS transporter n=1 Tax=Pseudoclavibacter sp. CFCC 14310 TaxID=2615180 RepID=UPI0013017276|nr:MFS transporter [Pseudoclavibacter sp. CFCC 14310]KAB1647051.1 MFS transporter [Pseudoclavibacter sp. CFCC 14310]